MCIRDRNSLFLAVVGTLITLVISSMCGYALAIYRFEIKYVNLVFGVFLLGTLIPGETLTVPQFSVISALGLYNNIWGVDVYKRQADAPWPPRGGGMKRTSRGAHRTPREKERETHDD